MKKIERSSLRQDIDKLERFMSKHVRGNMTVDEEMHQRWLRIRDKAIPQDLREFKLSDKLEIMQFDGILRPHWISDIKEVLERYEAPATISCEDPQTRVCTQCGEPLKTTTMGTFCSTECFEKHIHPEPEDG